MPPSMVYQKTSRHIDGHVCVYRDDLQQMFHLPLAEAACQIGLCETTFKKVCRRLGLEQWPFHKGAKRRSENQGTQRVKAGFVAPVPSSEVAHNLAPPSWSFLHPAPPFLSPSSTFPHLPPPTYALPPAFLHLPPPSSLLQSSSNFPGGGWADAVMDYLDECEAGGLSGFLSLLENEGEGA
mmetsp:Transcript_62831/g.148835  ORF Transcript_62831/g.148835 Transcript_62831/m.148835 type:complete len:181 (-) Transcript_62831:98-640(-)